MCVRYPERPEEGLQFGVMDSCETPNISAAKQTWALGKSHKY